MLFRTCQVGPKNIFRRDSGGKNRGTANIQSERPTRVNKSYRNIQYPDFKLTIIIYQYEYTLNLSNIQCPVYRGAGP